MESKIANVIDELYSIRTEVKISRPNVKFGDYSTNIALLLSKQIGKKPVEIAEDIITKLRQDNSFLEVNLAGPGFINICVSARSLADLLQEKWSLSFGENNDGEGKKVVVEYPSQNMAKPYSIGHLRPGNQGWAVKCLMEATGWNVITDNHLGDYGAPFGMWVVGFLNFSNDESLDNDGVYELGRIYIKIKKELKLEKETGKTILADQVQDWLLKLEANDSEAIYYSRKFNKISLDHIHTIMARLNIHTDYELGEAFFAPKGKQAVQKLLAQGIAQKNDDGSVIVKLDEYGFDVPILIQKANGAALYATTDLATILYREDTWKPDRVIYAVGSEQQYYFMQLFALANKIGVQTELIHVWFGVIDQINEDGTRSKMSSRKGVVLMEDLLNTAEDRARQVTKGRNVSDEDIKKIALGAIKFSDFVADRRTDILFDWDSIFALSGFSGPYIQYAAVRVNKILSDNINHNTDYINDGYDYESEKSVLINLLDYPGVVRLAARDLEPHKIASYLYNLAKEMNRYYEQTPIATGDISNLQKTARLDLLTKVSHVFRHGLNLLGIEVPSQM